MYLVGRLPPVALTRLRPSGTLTAVDVPLKRYVAVAVLLGCQTPSGFAVVAGLELAAHVFAFEHEHDTADLARSATHGHHHDDEVVPDHDHDARLDAPAMWLWSETSSSAVLATPLPSSVKFAGSSLFGAASRRGPPPHLFRPYSALLL